MKRIASLTLLFAALIEFAIEGARFDLWIVIVAMVLVESRDTSTLLSYELAQARPQRVRFEEIVCNLR
jgi:hypothetical protein